MKLKNKYTLNPVETYKIVVGLRKKHRRFGLKKIKKQLNKLNIKASDGAIRGWIYYNKKPFVTKIIKQISENSNKLTKEKAYILGTLCGDGYTTTGHRIGLSVIDKEFAEYFKYCLEKVYGVKCSFSIRNREFTSFSNSPKPQYVVSLVSKLVVQDLNRYSTSFKSKEWSVPNKILNNSKEIQAAFIKGFADSEGSVRFRKGQSEITLCSGNRKSLEMVKGILKNNFKINSYSGKRNSSTQVIVVTKYVCLKKFHDEIGFIIKRKQDRLEQALNSYKRKGIKRYPKEIKLKAINMLKKGLNHREIAKILGTNHTNIYDWEKAYNK